MNEVEDLLVGSRVPVEPLLRDVLQPGDVREESIAKLRRDERIRLEDLVEARFLAKGKG